MEAIIDFIQSYWQYLSFGFLFIVELLIFFLKKRPKTLDDFESALADVCNLLPTWIKTVEKPGNGVQKKELVIEKAFHSMGILLHRTLTKRESDIVEGTVTGQIEKILETPQKKG